MKRAVVATVMGVALALLAAGLAALPCFAKGPGEKASRKSGSVGVVFFSSATCPRCDHVKELLQSMRGHYPLRIKKFDIEKKPHDDLFSRLEVIHGAERFAVPLVIVGDNILIGEDRIGAELEPLVRSLAKAGGAPFPYLGPQRAPGRMRIIVDEPLPPAPAKSADCNCGKGKPPPVGEELRRVKGLLRKLF
jgi:hypothetical protein